MFERSKLESLRDVSLTRIGDTLFYGFSQTVLLEASGPRILGYLDLICEYELFTFPNTKVCATVVVETA